MVGEMYFWRRFLRSGAIHSVYFALEENRGICGLKEETRKGFRLQREE